MVHMLAESQHWFRDVVTHPDGVIAGAESPSALARFDDAPDFLEDIVRSSPSLTALDRLEIYQRGYFQRLVNCLAELLPVLRHALGAELFEMFAVEYLRQNPSQSHTLAELDAGFVEYLSSTRPDRDDPDAEREDWPDFIIDLATLERDIRTTYDGPGAEDLALLPASAVDSLEDSALLDTTFVTVPCLSLRSFRFPVRSYLLSVRRGEDPVLPGPAPTWLALNRRDFTVRLVDLTEPQHQLLAALAIGERVVDAVDHADISDRAFVRSSLVRFADAGLFLAPPTSTPKDTNHD